MSKPSRRAARDSVVASPGARVSTYSKLPSEDRKSLAIESQRRLMAPAADVGLTITKLR
jgi:hypothetical protein